jgi:subtilisin family serine protease
LPGLDDEDVSFESDQTSYRIAVQAPEACVATTYTVTESTMFQRTAASEVAIVSTDDEDDQRYVVQEDVSVTSAPEGDDEPRDEPVENTSTASTPEDGGTRSDVAQDDIPVASVPEEGDEPEEVPVEDKPDLGLVKAQETIVILVLTNKTDGQPVTNAVAKMLPEEPPLPGSSTEIAYDDSDSEALFEDDVEGGFSDDDGSVQLSVATGDAAPTGDDGGDKQSQEDADKETTAASDGNVAQADPKQTSAQTRTLTLSIDAEPREQLVAGLADDTPAVEAVSTAISDPALAPFVAHAFSIGTHTLLVLSAPRSEAPALKDQLKTSAIVAWFELNLCRNKEEIDDPYFSHAGLWGQNYDDQWAIKRVGFSEEFITEAKERPDIKPVTVAVIDTGLDWYHPDLDQDSIWRNEGEIPDNGIDDDGNGYIDDIIGWNFVNENNRPWDYDGHGTFVAGVIAAATNNSAGIAGISPHARIMPLKALDEFGQGHASMIAEAIAYAADNGARVINLSLGGRGLTRVEKLAVEHAAASGALVVVAAGNSAADVSEYGPAGLDGVITVSATDQGDHQAGFSNWGEEIDISAPGVDVLSLRARKTDLLSYIRGVKYDVGAGIVGDDRAYYRASGTSFAAPIVTGAAALIMSLRPEVDAMAARRMLLSAAKDIETPGIDNFTGYGLLDIQKALAADPDFAVESRIDRVEPIKVQGKPALRLIGTADASEFDSASLALGSGKEPKNWRRLKKRIEKPVRGGVLMDLPAGAFQGSKVWTIRLISRHKNGEEREARFIVTLG